MIAVFIAFFILRAIDGWLGLGIFKEFDRFLDTINQQINGEEQLNIPNDADFEVHFIDVGQGDSILIRSDGYDILIDAGENDKGKVVTQYLERVGVDKLDLAIGTHAHSDHIGGLDVVIKEIETAEVVMPKMKKSVVPTTKTYTDLLKAIKSTGAKSTTAQIGAKYTFGNGTLTILGPVMSYDDLNDTSVVARFDYGDASFLFTGDMEKEAERDLIAAGAYLDADVLKLGHHGSSTSSCEEFYDKVSPVYAIVLCGVDNEYGHPHDETEKLVKDKKDTMYRTDIQGTIVVTVKDGKYTFTTEKG